MVISELPSESVLPLLKDTNTIAISSINYENRSLKWLLDLPKDSFKAALKILLLRSRSNNVALLEQIKDSNVEQAKKQLNSLNTPFDFLRVEYPEGFDRELLKRTMTSLCDGCATPELNIILDITAIPRVIILSFLEAIYETQRLGKISPKLYITYTAASKYPHLEYPHEVGYLVTYFSNKRLHEFLKEGDYVNLVVVPSIYGFETRLLAEELIRLNVHVREFSVVIPFYKHNVLTSIEVLRMNPGVLPRLYSTYDCRLHFVFSIHDAMEMILDLSNWDARDEVCLIAPFNVKPLIVPAFCSCKHLFEKGIKRADIVRMSGIQYSSLYSYGAGEVTSWRVRFNAREDQSMQGQ